MNRFDEKPEKFDENKSELNRKETTKLEIKKLEQNAKNDKYSDLLTKQKSWEKVDKQIPNIVRLASEINATAVKLAKLHTEINKAILDVFHTAPKTDTALSLSPLSPGRVWGYLEVDLIKSGLSHLRAVSNLHLKKSFDENIREGLLWLTKLKTGDQLYGTKQQREQQLASKRSNGQ